MVFAIGQRWISNTESQLGLGIITDLSGRQVHVFFPAAEEERIYARETAPLSRIVFKEGDIVSKSLQAQFTVSAVKEESNLIIYTAIDEEGLAFQIREQELNAFIKLSSPQQRLFSGLLDTLNAFKLRIETLNHLSRLQQSSSRGLIGSRTSHLAHQIYIAHEVAQRYAPRVMLADEVGLGKTIEAGMILHYQLYTGRASRVLIVVPNSLIHQWFIEMRRRFNLNFSIFDQERYDESLDIESNQNLFESEQLILCSLDFLLTNEKALEHAMSTDWDLLVVDEAHHLHWEEDQISTEYAVIEAISSKAKGLLLLTATPEQVGIQSHFSRLKLLDPFRFHDFKQFLKEEEHYKSVNALVQELIRVKKSTQSDDLPSSFKDPLRAYFDKKIPSSIERIIQELLDRHGTGRVLFRNTRQHIAGFPKRSLHQYPLARPSIYPPRILEDGITGLFPERLVDNEVWLKEDPRVVWLASKLNALAPEKVLVICAKAKTATVLEQHLKRNLGIRSTAFHGGLTIIERDRAAAYFSEEDKGAQALICSEIGSEGRNFQFAHHLILFDLPLNPDLLEQRIGRLDRIGQRQTIEIHVPYLMNTPQEVLFRWYHEGIGLFEKSCSLGYTIFETLQKPLISLLDSSINSIDGLSLDKLITKTKQYMENLNQALSEGRDTLLEMNSCNLDKAQALIAAIEVEENSMLLENYMSKVFQEYSVEQEQHSEQTEILRPTTQMQVSHFPGLTEEETTVTYSRQKALIREDMQFLSWEHPIVSESMDLILHSELGNANLASISIPSIKAGSLFVESFYTINCAAPKHLQLDRFLPLTPIRLFMDVTGKNLSKIISYDQLNQLCATVKRHLATAVISQVRDDLEFVIKQANQLAETEMVQQLESAKIRMKDFIGQEIDRLENLQKANRNIRDEEIQFFKKQIKDCELYLQNAALQLQALRVIINK